MLDKDSFLLGLLFALLVCFLLYYIVKSVKQERYIDYLHSIIEKMQKSMLGKDFEKFLQDMDEKINKKDNK